MRGTRILALVVKISINHIHKVATYGATRIKGGNKPDDMNTYEMNTGHIIKHRYGDGAEELVRKMMEAIKEEG